MIGYHDHYELGGCVFCRGYYDTREDSFAGGGMCGRCWRRRNAFAPVRPERSEARMAAYTAKSQAEDMQTDRACPTCMVGLIPYGEAICQRCRIECDVAEAHREARERVIAKENAG